jgi:hypothetical protein
VGDAGRNILALSSANALRCLGHFISFLNPFPFDCSSENRSS